MTQKHHYLMEIHMSGRRTPHVVDIAGTPHPGTDMDAVAVCAAPFLASGFATHTLELSSAHAAEKAFFISARAGTSETLRRLELRQTVKNRSDDEIAAIVGSKTIVTCRHLSELMQCHGHGVSSVRDGFADAVPISMAFVAGGMEPRLALGAASAAMLLNRDPQGMDQQDRFGWLLGIRGVRKSMLGLGVLSIGAASPEVVTGPSFGLASTWISQDLRRAVQALADADKDFARLGIDILKAQMDDAESDGYRFQRLSAHERLGVLARMEELRPLAADVLRQLKKTPFIPHDDLVRELS